MTYGQPSPFPPSFEGNPFAYGFGLFGDVVAASLALAMLLAYMFDGQRARRASKALHNPVVNPPLPRWSLLWIYRAFNIGVLLFIVMRALPDALWMLLWGEVSKPTIEVLLAIDLLCDGLALIPFFVAILCWAWGRQTIPQVLFSERGGGRVTMPGIDMWCRNARIVVVVLLISIGVTLGKVGG